MALDSTITAGIDVQFAGDKIASRLEEYVTKLNERLVALSQTSDKLQVGSKKNANAVRAEVQTIQRLVGEANTLLNIINSVKGRAQQGIFSPLEQQRLGNLALEASKIRNGLDGASKASEALAQRLALIRKEADAVTKSGQTVRRSVVVRADSFSNSLRDIKALETSIRRIDQDALARGGFSGQSAKVRQQLEAAQAALLEKISNKRTSNFEKEIGLVRRLRDELRQSVKQEEQAAATRLRNIEREERAANELAERKRVLRKKAREEAERDAARELALLNRLEQQQNRELAYINRVERARTRNEQRLTARTNRLLVPQGMRELSQQIGAQATLERMKRAQLAAEEALAAATGKARESAARALEVANMRVRAAERLVRAEEQVARARTPMLSRVNMNEAQLRASLERGASQFRFTDSQLRNTDMVRTGQTIERNIQRLMVMQQLMSRALAPGSGKTPEALERLQRVWERISMRTSEAIALRRQYEQLPEQRGARIRATIMETMFGDGGLALGTRMAGAIGIGMGISALFSGVSASLRTISQMEDELAKLQAISGSTDGEMQNLSRSIFEVGNNSRYSTLEIAQGATTIAQAGFAAAETNEVLKNALDLAAASGSTPAESIDLMTSALGAFNLQANESAVVADTITAALNETKLSVEQMRLALQYAGATAKENNISLQELAAISGSLANAGIRSGSTIGTGIRQLLVDLKTPTEDFKRELDSLGLTLADVDVKALGLAEVVRRLTDAGFSAEQAYASFEVRAASSFLAFRNQIDSYDDLALALQQQGAAARAAEEASGSLSAKWTELKNNLLDLVVTLGGPFIDILKTVLDSVTAVTKTIGFLITGLAGATEGSNVLAQSLGSALLPALLGFSFGGPMGAVIGGVLGFTSALAQADTTTNEFTESANKAKQALDSQEQTVISLTEAKNSLIEREEVLSKNTNALEAETLNLMNRFDGLASKIDMTTLSYEGLLQVMTETTEESLRLQQTLADKVAFETGREASSFRSSALTQMRQLGLVNQDAMAFRDLPQIKSRIDTLLRGNIDDPNFYRNLLALINDIDKARPEGPRLGNEGDIYRRLLRLAEAVVQYRSSSSEARSAQNTSNRIEAYFNTGGPRSSQTLTDINRRANEGERKNKQSGGSGDGDLKGALRDAEAELERLQKLAKTFAKGSPEALTVSGLINETRATINNINRALNPPNADGRSGTPGGFLTSKGVGELLTQEFGVRVTDTTRTAAQQRAYGTWKGPAEQAPHVTGRAVDIAVPKDGTTPEQMKAFLEEKGFVGVKIITRRHGTGPHWHIEWQSQKSTGLLGIQKDEQKKAEQEARDLQQLLQFEARSRVGEIDAQITELGLAARSGRIRPVDALTQFDSLIEQRNAAKINEFEVSNPTEGLTRAALEQRTLALEQLKKQNEAQAKALLETIWRGIADAAFKAYDSAIQQIELQTQEARFAEELRFEGVASVGRTRDNFFNRNRNDAGTRFLQEQAELNAGVVRDRGIADALASEIAGRRAEIEKLKAEIASLKEGTEAYDDAQKRLAQATQELNKIDRERLQLLQSIDERTRVVGDLPLEERLRGAAMAWRESSGAMQDFNTQLANNVGPALDNLSNGFTDFFTSIADGTKTFKQALGDMLRSFIGFVQQMVMRALALMAVRAILSAFGLGSVGGNQPGVDASFGINPNFAFNGGPVGDIPGMMGGGRVNAPSPLRDSKLFALADGEYVVRNKSVRELGLPFMNAINKHGKKGLDKMAGSAFTNIQMPRQETNVWVVAEKQQAGIGPNDVLVTIHNDIIQGGPTKKLIKQVAQGG